MAMWGRPQIPDPLDSMAGGIEGWEPLIQSSHIVLIPLPSGLSIGWPILFKSALLRTA